MEQGESAASFGGKQSQEDQQVADIGFHLKVIEPFSISLHSLGLLRSHRSKLMLWEAKKGGSSPLQSTCGWEAALTLAKWDNIGVHFFEPLHPCEDKMSIKKSFHF